ncbi:MAG TPA: hypothetical protein VLA29_12175 [Acidimicrobiia bacterium]|nr:hypothetical protein [Acidimicrobiia bacterium]
MDDMTERQRTLRPTGTRYWWVSTLLLGVLALTVVNIVSTISRMESRNALMAPFLECVEQSGGTFTEPTQWMKAGGRPIVIDTTDVSAEDLEIHRVCWEQVHYTGP